HEKASSRRAKTQKPSTPPASQSHRDAGCSGRLHSHRPKRAAALGSGLRNRKFLTVPPNQSIDRQARVGLHFESTSRSTKRVARLQIVENCDALVRGILLRKCCCCRGIVAGVRRCRPWPNSSPHSVRC